MGVISKDVLPQSASDWAQGGIAAVTDPQDSFALHVEDTLRAGVGLCDLEAVQFLVEQAPRCIQSLLSLGVAFDRQGSGLAMTLEAAHSRRRVLHAADTTGREVVSVLTAQVMARKNITILSPAFALDLWLDRRTRDCRGVALLYQGTLHWLRAGAVILATGGGGQVYAQTTNPAVSTGDGVAIAWRSGAILRDLEFMQFHPTALTRKGAPRFLISEAVRGEGAHLVDRQGHRFAFDYHPSGELAPRDVVSRAIFSHLQRTEADPASAHVWLDLRPIPVDRIRYRFPNIIQVCQKWGIDLFQEPIPVAPAAHYWMGGIATDLMNRTTIPGLYAVGETASTGVHGANRLASNSLLECLVFGAQFAHLEVREVPDSPPHAPEMPLPAISPEVAQTELAAMRSLRSELQRLVWQGAGIVRSQDSLEAAIAEILQQRTQFAQLQLSQALSHLSPGLEVEWQIPDFEETLHTWGEVRNLLDVGYLILKSAHFRTESRGGHYRLDYPETDEGWQAHTLVQTDRWWRSDPIPPVPENS